MASSSAGHLPSVRNIIRTATLVKLCCWQHNWTPGGEIVGGTGMAIRMAERAGVPVLNLAVHSPRDVCLFLRNRYLYPPAERGAGRASPLKGEGA